MKKLVLLFSLVAFLAVSCAKKEVQEPQVSFTPCQQTKATKSELSDTVNVEFTNEGVKITHYNFEVTCDFSAVNVTHSFVNGVLRITQQGYPNQAKCICYSDVSYTINGISKDEVNVIFINDEQVYCYNDNGNTTAFCSYLNLENIDKTIPVINDYLETLDSHLNDEQKIQALTAWLKSSPCVIDADILCISCIKTLPAMSEISFSFQDDGATIEVVLDIIMRDTLKAGICSIKDISNGQSNEECENVECYDSFESVSIILKYPDGQPVLLDSCRVFWESKSRYLEINPYTWNDIRVWGIYVIVDDGMRKELRNRQEIMRFTGYLNGKTVIERDVLVGADCCHVAYLGEESLTHVVNRQSNIKEGIYSGTFSSPLSSNSDDYGRELTLELKNGRFNSTDYSERLPSANGAGTYSLKNDTIIFRDELIRCAATPICDPILIGKYHYIFDGRILKLFNGRYMFDLLYTY